MPICHTPNLPVLQRNGIPGGDCHSITVTVILNDLKCRFENTTLIIKNIQSLQIQGPKMVLQVYEKQVIRDQRFHKCMK
jgi:hypothetical protein